MSNGNEQTENQHKQRPRGTGSIYRQKDSVSWWIQYFLNGKRHRESANTTKKWKAEKFLQKRLAEVSTGNFIGPTIERVRVSELADDLLRDYRINGRKSLEWAERRWNLHLQPFFGELRAAQVCSDLIERYVDERQQAKAKNATINRELAFLKRAFKLGFRASPPKVYRVPSFPALEERNVRKGFLRDDAYTGLATECAREGLWLRALLAVAYNFGWRKTELLGLRVRQIDLASRTIRLEVGETKNDDGRTIKMTDEVFTLLGACVSEKQPDDYVFTRADGKPVRDFRKAWRNACKRAGVPELLLHDLRRTGVRNLRRLGVAESVAMKISGHKTASIFRRYDITDEADLADAARRLDEKRQAQADISHSSAIVGPSNPPIVEGVNVN